MLVRFRKAGTLYESADIAGRDGPDWTKHTRAVARADIEKVVIALQPEHVGMKGIHEKMISILIDEKIMLTRSSYLEPVE